MGDTPPSLTDSPKAKRVFIVACRRSGTTWVTMLLSQHPQVVGVQQSSFFHRVDYLAKYLDEDVKYGRHIITAEAKADSGKQDAAVSSELARRPIRAAIPLERFHYHMRAFAEEVYDRLAQCTDDTLAVVDHQPENVRSWKHIIEIFPDAYFLHVVRDPRSVYSSYVHSAKSWSNPATFPTDPRAFSAEWKSDVSVGREIRLRTERHLEVRYEELIANGPAQLRRIHEFLGLEASDEERVEAIEACSLDRLRASAHGPRDFFRKGQARGWKAEVPRSRVEVIEYECGPLMDELGYARNFVKGNSKPLSMRVRDKFRHLRWSLQRRVRRQGSA